MRLHTIVAALALATAVPAAAVPAAAMPVAQPIPLAGTEDPAVTLTAGGCGLGFHRGFYGGCRPNFYGGYGWRRPWGWRGGYGWHRGWGWHRHWGWRRW